MKKLVVILKFYWLTLGVLFRGVEGDVYLRWCRLNSPRAGLPFR